METTVPRMRWWGRRGSWGRARETHGALIGARRARLTDHSLARTDKASPRQSHWPADRQPPQRRSRPAPGVQGAPYPTAPGHVKFAGRRPGPTTEGAHADGPPRTGPSPTVAGPIQADAPPGALLAPPPGCPARGTPAARAAPRTRQAAAAARRPTMAGGLRAGPLNRGPSARPRRARRWPE